MTSRPEERPRTIRSFATIPYGTPLVQQAAWLYEHAARLAQREHADVDDALAVLALTTSLYHRWDGIRQAVRVGATVEEIAVALGLSMDDTQDLIRRIEERDREIERYFQQASA